MKILHRVFNHARTAVETMYFIFRLLSRFIRNSTRTFRRDEIAFRGLLNSTVANFHSRSLTYRITPPPHHGAVVNRPCNKLPGNVSAARRFKKVLPSRQQAIEKHHKFISILAKGDVVVIRLVDDNGSAAQLRYHHDDRG